jgi:hypothetical protein
MIPLPPILPLPMIPNCFLMLTKRFLADDIANVGRGSEEEEALPQRRKSIN